MQLLDSLRTRVLRGEPVRQDEWLQLAHELRTARRAAVEAHEKRSRDQWAPLDEWFPRDAGNGDA